MTGLASTQTIWRGLLSKHIDIYTPTARTTYAPRTVGFLWGLKAI